MILRSLAALCVASLMASGCGRNAQPATFTLSLVGTNDLHGAVLENNGRGGLALLDGYLANLRAARQRDGGAVLLVDAGDLFQGTLESNLGEGDVVVDAYNTIGYQAATIGNHEFDYGPSGSAAIPQAPGDDARGALKARLAQSRFPWVAANLLQADTGARVQWPNVTPSTIVSVNGVRIGVVGLLTHEALTATMAANVSDLTVAPLDKALIDEATRVRAAGASIVIGLAHAGGACADTTRAGDLSSCDSRAEIFAVAHALPPGLVDAIVAGHRHAQIAHEVNGVPIIESASSGREFGRIDFAVDRRTGRATGHHVFPPRELCALEAPQAPGCATESMPDARPAEYEGGAVVPSSRIAGVLAPAVARAAAMKTKPLGTTVLMAPLTRSTTGQSPVGDLVADWMKALVPDADVAIANSGGLRANLPEGPLTYGRLYEVMPFDNQRVVVTLTGAQLRTVLAASMTTTSGSTIVLSGIRATASCAAGELKVAIGRESGRPVRDSDVLKVVTVDFLATGGDGIFTPVQPLHVVATGGVVRDEIAALLTRAGRRWGGDARMFRPRITVNGKQPLECASR
jgi:2',3'-cyclic-nucleotide 2'-phosphodiesterase (5'-nucleotidase family)